MINVQFTVRYDGSYTTIEAYSRTFHTRMEFEEWVNAQIDVMNPFILIYIGWVRGGCEETRVYCDYYSGRFSVGEIVDAIDWRPVK